MDKAQGHSSTPALVGPVVEVLHDPLAITAGNAAERTKNMTGTSIMSGNHQ